MCPRRGNVWWNTTPQIFQLEFQPSRPPFYEWTAAAFIHRKTSPGWLFPEVGQSLWVMEQTQWSEWETWASITWRWISCRQTGCLLSIAAENVGRTFAQFLFCVYIFDSESSLVFGNKQISFLIKFGLATLAKNNETPLKRARMQRTRNKTTVCQQEYT